MTDATDSHARLSDARITQAVDNVVRPLHRLLETELASLVEELAGAVAAERTAALELARAAATAEKESAVREAVAAARAAHETALEQVRNSAAAEQENAVRDAVEAARAGHEAELNAVRQTLLAGHQADLDSVRTALASEHEAAVRNFQAASEAAASVAIAEAVAEAVSAAKAEGAAALAEAASAAEQRRAEHVAEAEAKAAGALQEALTDTVASERQAELALVERVLGTIRKIDAARSMSEVLDAVADHVLVESGRVAVFLVRGQALRGWRFVGFPAVAGEPHQVELKMEESGIIARAVSAHSCAATSDRGLPAGEIPPLPAGSLLSVPEGRAGFAVPVCVAGQIVAVVYADEGDAPAPRIPSPWPETAEVIARHASRCLELLMAARVAAWTRPAPAEEPAPDPEAVEAAARARAAEDEDAARRYARLLISEIKLYHESDVNLGKRERDMLQRLKPEIDRARRLFEERVPPDVRARTSCFEQELVRTLADGNASLLGQST